MKVLFYRPNVKFVSPNSLIQNHIRNATIMRGFFGNCAMRDAGDLGKIVRQNPQNLSAMRCYAGLCRGKNYQYKKWIQLKSLLQYRNISCLIVSDLRATLSGDRTFLQFWGGLARVSASTENEWSRFLFFLVFCATKVIVWAFRGLGLTISSSESVESSIRKSKWCNVISNENWKLWANLPLLRSIMAL